MLTFAPHDIDEVIVRIEVVQAAGDEQPLSDIDMFVIHLQLLW